MKMPVSSTLLPWNVFLKVREEMKELNTFATEQHVM